MQIDTSKTYSVINSETEIGVKNFETKKEAEQYAKFLTEYHHEKYEVRKIEW